MADRISTAPLAVQAMRARREWRQSQMYATLKRIRCAPAELDFPAISTSESVDGAPCPSCGSARLTHIVNFAENFERWTCSCGATGRPAASPGSPLEEVPLPASVRRSAPPTSSDLRSEESPL